MGRRRRPTIKKVETLCNIFCDKFSGREVEREGIKSEGGRWTSLFCVVRVGLLEKLTLEVGYVLCRCLG